MIETILAVFAFVFVVGGIVFMIVDSNNCCGNSNFTDNDKNER